MKATSGTLVRAYTAEDLNQIASSKPRERWLAKHPGGGDVAPRCDTITRMVEDELALLDRWCSGDKTAGNVLFMRYFASVYRFLQNKADVDGDVDDLVQETFLECVRGRDRFRRQSSFRTYLFAIARHILYGYWRRRRGDRASIDFDEISIASLSTSAGSRIARNEDRARLLEALRALPVEQQLLLELHYWEEFDRAQLAEVFDVEEATTRSRLFRAREALRERLDAAQTSRITSNHDFDEWARSLRPKLRNTAAEDDTT